MNFDEYIQWIRSDAFDVATQPNQAVFWSGTFQQVSPDNISFSRQWNEDAAKQSIEDSGRTLIGTTHGGNDLEKRAAAGELKDFTREQQTQIWEEASKKYAEQASGDVATRVVGAFEPRVFRQVELGTLLENDEVTSINGIAREDLKALYDQDKDAAFKKVCEAEVANRLDEAQRTQDPLAMDQAQQAQRFLDAMSHQAANDNVPSDPFGHQAANDNAAPPSWLPYGDRNERHAHDVLKLDADLPPLPPPPPPPPPPEQDETFTH